MVVGDCFDAEVFCFPPFARKAKRTGAQNLFLQRGMTNRCPIFSIGANLFALERRPQPRLLRHGFNNRSGAAQDGNRSHKGKLLGPGNRLDGHFSRRKRPSSR
jgi:hypothetical protein